MTGQQVADLLGATIPDAAGEATWSPVQSPTPTADLFEGSVCNPINGMAIPCLLYRPANGNSRGGVVAIHQHNDEYELGKSEPAGLSGNPDAAYGRTMAEKGFTVIMPDLDCFESRADPAGNHAKYELSRALNAVALGRSLHAEYVQDVLACARYLEGLNGVTGVGLIGHSLGGQIAFLCLAIDPRIEMGVISCGLTTFEACRSHDVVHNPGWYIPGLEAEGGYEAIAAGIRGKQILATAAQDDVPFPAEGARRVQQAFADGVLHTVWREGPHDLTPDALAHMTDWLEAAITRPRVGRPPRVASPRTG
ncbi:alpha/beta hydrolase [Tessaracoccus sp. OS52]|uniref:alpha/beta hydrolase family protein n=1 Tax=Tessaracoccus sp. OS52 TaxID=2886691 RepID=UPI001D12E544|nr:alpha/beta hydrolase [Tessaracoccus sp. OS52]MCC2592838.1 alpha/beta hydrolase [Tessaracoccus sp. OS52]